LPLALIHRPRLPVLGALAAALIALGLLLAPAGTQARGARSHGSCQSTAKRSSTGRSARGQASRSRHASSRSCPTHASHKGKGTHKRSATKPARKPAASSPPVQLAPASCEDGSLPSGAGSTCEDGSQPTCEDGSAATRRSKAGAPMCVVSEDAKNGECDRAGECLTVEWTCEDSREEGSTAGCEPEPATIAEAPAEEEE
jgi:hypothetical protein